MIGGRIPVELPPVAAQKLNLLSVAVMVSQDACRAVSSRLSNLPHDAQVRQQLEAERTRHNRRHQQLSMLQNRVNQWLMQLRGVVLEIAPAIVAKLQDGETSVTEAVNNVRAEIVAVSQRLAATKAAPLPLSDQVRAAEQFVAKLASTVKPTVGVMRDDQIRLTFRDGIVSSTDDLMPLLCEIFPQAVQSWLERKIEQQPTPLNPLPASARIAAVAELEKTLCELEQREQALIQKAHGEGIEILPRPDANPAIVLGVVVAKAKAQAQQQVPTMQAVG
jgi:hypothetical protein